MEISESYHSEEDLTNYLRISEFNTFKDEFLKLQKDIHYQFVELKSDHDVFTQENMTCLKRLEHIDVTILESTEALE